MNIHKKNKIVLCITLFACCVPLLNGSERKDLVSSGEGLLVHKTILEKLGENALHSRPYVVEKDDYSMHGTGFIVSEDGRVCGNVLLTKTRFGVIAGIALERYQLTKNGDITYNRTDWKNKYLLSISGKPFFNESGNFCLRAQCKTFENDGHVPVLEYSLPEEGSGIALCVE